MDRKRILILGATGATGQAVVTQALEAGHQVTAFVRNPSGMPVRHESLRLIAGDVTDEKSGLADAVRGQDAVISALGRGMSFKSTDLIQRSVPPILAAMKSQRVRRLIFTSAIGVGSATDNLPLISRMMIRFPLRDIYADKVAGEALIRRSDLDWTLVQPAQLTTGPLTRKYRAGERLDLRGIPKISRGDTAHFILRQLDDTSYIRKVVLIAY